MKRTVTEIQTEYRRFSSRLNTCREALEKRAGYLSELQLAGYKTSVRDCEERIAELIQEAGTMIIESQS